MLAFSPKDFGQVKQILADIASFLILTPRVYYIII